MSPQTGDVTIGIKNWIRRTLVDSGTGTSRAVADRALRVANKIRKCDPRNYKSPPYRFASSYGLTATVARELGRFSKETRRFGMRHRYTDRLHEKVVRSIEELGKIGYREAALKRFLSQKPEASELEDLARNLYWLANKKYCDEHNISYQIGD